MDGTGLSAYALEETLQTVAAQNKRIEAGPATTARDYYDELYRAGALDNFADQFVCFRDDSAPTFFLLAKSDALKQFLGDNGALQKLPLREQKDLEKGFLIRRTYRKGIANVTEYFEPREHDDSYVEELNTKMPMIMRLRVNWQTLRYILDVEQKSTGRSLAEDSGKCEEVSPTVPQHGHGKDD
jgi:hypothetical protein